MVYGGLEPGGNRRRDDIKNEEVDNEEEVGPENEQVEEDAEVEGESKETETKPQPIKRRRRVRTEESTPREAFRTMIHCFYKSSFPELFKPTPDSRSFYNK
ncbi:hypothetical protein Dimus_036054 [Dionaea muscipula]